MKQLFIHSPLVGLGLAVFASQPVLPREAPAAKPAMPSVNRVGTMTPSDPKVTTFFETKVRPVLAEQCYKCHGPDRQLGNLRVDSRAALLQGGGGGAAVVPGHPEKSLLVKAVHYDGLKMPPGGKLKAAEIAALTEWVKLGAPWPGDEGKPVPAARLKGKITAADRSYWAFQPVRKPAVPNPPDNGWSKTPIDRFIVQRLRTEGLTPAPEANRTALVRRLYFDLIGLPPTPEEVEAFVKDTAPDAYEKLVDRLLASPRYGEKWARHWLDLVRYADSDGYRADAYRPHSWRYRDYVIQAFNNDKPYDRFVQEQLAGDELFPGNPEALIATGYLRHGIYEYNARDVRGQWTTVLNDLTDTTGDVFLGLGLQCARCHDHKFDPILQKDYYRLQAFFAPILPREDLMAATEQEKAEYQQRLAAWEAKAAGILRQIDAIEAPYRQAAAHKSIEMFPDDIKAMIRKPVAQREPLEHQLAELAYRQVYYEYERLDGRIKGEDKEKLVALRKQLAAFDAEKPAPLPVAFGATDVGPKASPVYIPKRETEPIEPGFLTVLDERPASVQPLPNSTGRRSALARWLTRPGNPLTSRVIVNRIWQYHFGRGLAPNSSDFGRLGGPPSHPELLDWMATRFVEDGWSFKKLHRLIVTSATYRQSTHHPQAARFALKDPENKLYWRGDTRRLDAEQIRDALYAVSGELNLKTGGPGANSTEPRRTIYTRVMRNTRDPLLDVFDLPQFFTSAAFRETTTTPVQSLLLINSQTLLLRAQAMADRLEREAGDDPERQVVRAYQLALGRTPSATETASALRFLQEQAGRVDAIEAGSAAAEFRYDKIPYRDGQAAVMDPKGKQKWFEVPHDGRFPAGEFTVEAFILPRSVYDSGAVRTIAAKWSGNTNSPGWGLGITGKGSRRKPQTLVLQLVGKKRDGTVGEAALFSDHHFQLNKPYYVAASVKLATPEKPGVVTFFVKDLANDDEPLLTAQVEHAITGGLGNTVPLTLGGRKGQDAFFDGLVDDVRVSRGALDLSRLLYTVDGVQRETVAYWQFEARPDVFRDASGNGLDIRPGSSSRANVEPRRAALEDFCHILFNANEFLYVN